MGISASASDELEAEAGSQAEAAIADARERLPDGVPVTTFVEAGVPKEAILDHVDDHGVDLVVMATHGRTGLQRYLLGSVTEKVVRLADAPVVTVRADDSDGE